MFPLIIVWMMIPSISESMCPFQNLAQEYNFSGEWIMTQTGREDDINIEYLMRVCHPSGDEIFFGISYIDKPNWLIGFGSGNWSSYNQHIGGIKYLINGINNTIDESGFIISMSQQEKQQSGHDNWQLRDRNNIYKLSVNNQDYNRNDKCAIPYGYDKRIEKQLKLKNKLERERYFPFQIKQREKMIAKIEKRNENGDKNDQIGRLREAINKLTFNSQIAMTDDENPDLVIIPTLFDKTFININNNNDDIFNDLKVTFNDDNTFCMRNTTDDMNQTITVSNVSTWYNGIAFYSNWRTRDGQFGTLFFLQYDKNKLLASVQISNEEIQQGFSTIMSLVETSDAVQCVDGTCAVDECIE